MRWSEEETEQFLGNLLRTGVMVSGLVVLAGGILYLLRYGTEVPHYHLFTGEPEELKSFRGIFETAFEGKRRAMIQAGLLLLIATPVARVAFSIFAFWKQRDRLYTALTLAVLSILIFSLFSR